MSLQDQEQETSAREMLEGPMRKLIAKEVPTLNQNRNSRASETQVIVVIGVPSIQYSTCPTGMKS